MSHRTLEYRGITVNAPPMGENYRLQKAMWEMFNPRPAEEYHEDMGPVLWWRIPIEDEPYVGSPLDTKWVEDYYTHFTALPDPHIIQENAKRS